MSQNFDHLWLVYLIHNGNDKNDKGLLLITISKNTSLDFCCESTLIKIRQTCVRN